MEELPKFVERQIFMGVAVILALNRPVIPAVRFSDKINANILRRQVKCLPHPKRDLCVMPDRFQIGAVYRINLQIQFNQILKRITLPFISKGVIAFANSSQEFVFLNI